jgi:hypothetical protein
MSENQSLLSEFLNGENDYSKTSVEKVSSVIVTEYELGNLNPLRFLGRLEFLSQVIDKAKAEIREKSLSELEKYGSETKSGVKIDGISFKIKETGVRYDYSLTKSWTDKKSEIDILTEELKAIEATLKSLKSKATILDEETGELIELLPPIKTSKTSIEISLPK